MSKLIFHCLLFAIPHIPLRPLQYFFTSYNSSILFLFLKLQHDLVMFWIRIHMYSMAEKSSLTDRRCWAQQAGNWAASPWRVLSTVEMDGLMDIDGGGGLGVCFSSVLKSPCVSGPGGAEIAPVPLRSHSTRSPPCPGSLCVKLSVHTLSLSLFLPHCLSLFSPLWLNGLPRPLHQQGLCSRSWVCVLTNPQAN